MEPAAQHAVVIWPLILFLVAALGLVGLMLGLSHVLGGRHDNRLGNQPYESGIKPTGSARTKFSAKFYLVAIIFVLFDLEIVFIFSWAISARDLGWVGYEAFLTFLFDLALGLAYAWKIGALDWSPRAPRQKRLHAIESNQARHLPSEQTS